jgi:hypothetical protein
MKPQTWDWIKPISGGQNQYYIGRWIIPDKANYLFAGGDFKDSIMIDNAKIIRSLDSNLYLAKLKTNGDCIWLKRYPGFYMHQMKVTDASEIIIAWSDYGYSMSDTYTAHLAKLDSAGNQLWSRSINGNVQYGNFRRFDCIATDNAGNIFIRGRFSDTLKLGSLELVTNGASGFLAKCSSEGNFLWAKKIPHQNRGPNTVVHKKWIYYFYRDSLVTYDTSGTKLSSIRVINRVPANDEYDWGQAFLTKDSSGNLYRTETYSETIQLGSYNFTDTGNCSPPAACEGDIITYKMTPSGNVLWAKRVYGLYGDFAAGLSVTDDGKVYVVGVSFSTSPYQVFTENYSFNSSGFYIINYNSNGTLNQIAESSPIGCQASFHIEGNLSASNNNIFITSGYISNYAVFNTDTIYNYYGTYIGKININPMNTSTTPETLQNQVPKIFPNPSEGIVTINLNPNQAHRFEIYNFSGAKVHEGNIVNNQIVIDLSSKAKGAYLIRLVSDQAPLMFKVVIE